MNTLPQQILNTIGQTAPSFGQPVSQHSDSGTNVVTVVFELGQETLSRLDSLLAALATRVLPIGPGESQSLPRPVSLTSDSNHLTEPQSKKASPYLDAQQAAEYLGTKVKSLYGLVERRQLKPLRGPKRTYRFTKEILDEYLSRM